MVTAEPVITEYVLTMLRYIPWKPQRHVRRVCREASQCSRTASPHLLQSVLLHVSLYYGPSWTCWTCLHRLLYLLVRLCAWKDQCSPSLCLLWSPSQVLACPPAMVFLLLKTYLILLRLHEIRDSKQWNSATFWEIRAGNVLSPPMVAMFFTKGVRVIICVEQNCRTSSPRNWKWFECKQIMQWPSYGESVSTFTSIMNLILIV